MSERQKEHEKAAAVGEASEPAEKMKPLKLEEMMRWKFEQWDQQKWFWHVVSLLVHVQDWDPAQCAEDSEKQGLSFVWPASQMAPHTLLWLSTSSSCLALGQRSSRLISLSKKMPIMVFPNLLQNLTPPQVAIPVFPGTTQHLYAVKLLLELGNYTKKLCFTQGQATYEDSLYLGLSSYVQEQRSYGFQL